MTPSEIWQAGFDAARQWERDVASFWQDNNYGSPPKAPTNPYLVKKMQYLVLDDYDREWSDYIGPVLDEIPPNTDRLMWRWKP